METGGIIAQEIFGNSRCNKGGVQYSVSLATWNVTSPQSSEAFELKRPSTCRFCKALQGSGAKMVVHAVPQSCYN
jgi:hypothetical protein